jgi:hypothetical protein
MKAAGMFTELSPSIELILGEVGEAVADLQLEWSLAQRDVDERPEDAMRHLSKIVVYAETLLPISLAEVLEAAQALLAQLEIETEGETGADTPGRP